MEELVKKFLPYVMRELELDDLPHIELIDDDSLERTFGQYGGGKIKVVTKDRHPVDVLRTLAHELVHYSQDKHGILNQESGETGSDEENEANAVAGVIMRNFSKDNPEYIENRERLEETQLTEISDTHPGIREYLEKRGYQYLGDGMDQTAYYEPDTGLVLKIFGTNDRATWSDTGMPTFSAGHKMFFYWADYCMKNANNPFLPKFYGFESFQWEGKTYLQIRQEKLTENEDIGNDIARLGKLIFDYGMSEEEAADRMLHLQLPKDQFKLLCDTLVDLQVKAMEMGFNYDMHSANTMMRGNTPVLVDPWVSYDFT